MIYDHYNTQHFTDYQIKKRPTPQHKKEFIILLQSGNAENFSERYWENTEQYHEHLEPKTLASGVYEIPSKSDRSKPDCRAARQPQKFHCNKNQNNEK